ncbi:MAG: PHP domain-containing protein [Aliarcobacter sp.]
MARTLEETRPEVVVYFHPAVGMALQERVQDRSEAGFERVGVVLDAEDLPGWDAVTADLLWVADEGTAKELREKNPRVSEVVAGGWPVRPSFFPTEEIKGSRKSGAGVKILYLVNSRRRKASRTLEKLLEIEGVEVTAVVGREEGLKADLRKGLAEAKGRGIVHGWVKDLATMIRAHDLVVTKPGTISVREVLATGRPAILVEGGKGAEKRKGICRLATRIGCGALADSPGEIAARIKDALEGGGVGLREWGRRARKEANRSAGAMGRLAGRIAKMARAAQSTERVPELRLVMHGYSGRKGLLMVDLHTHSIFSDGRLTLREIVDFYGRRGFDAMAVTDHLVDRRRLLGRLASLSGLVLTLEDLPEYFRALAEERNRAWTKYRMILFPGLEFNHDGLTAKGSAHLLGVDLKEPIDPALSLKEICLQIRGQGGLTIAAHPHHMSSAWGKDTLYLWERQNEFRPLIDAWEIGNRDDLFNPVGLKRLPFIAGSDFHKPKHLTSWKTMLWCEKDPEAIKECIRQNKDISITLYRDHRFGGESEEREEKTATGEGGKASTLVGGG